MKLDHDALTFPENKVPHLSHSVDHSCLWPCRRVASKQACLHVSIEILFSPGCVPVPSKGRTHLKELAAGGREEASWSRSQPHHRHPYHPGGLLRAHLHAQLRARGRRCLYTLDFLEGWVSEKGRTCFKVNTDNFMWLEMISALSLSLASWHYLKKEKICLFLNV